MGLIALASRPQGRLVRMNESLALRDAPQPVALSSDQLAFISRTEFIPQGLRGNLPAILACVTTGRELGLGDMTSLRSIHIIDGKATFSAELMGLLVRKAGHSITGGSTGTKATAVGTRADNGDTMTVEWTLEMAGRVGLLNKSNWKKYPEAMLWARAVSQLCRMLFPDCFAGASYTPEELGSDATADELMLEATGEATWDRSKTEEGDRRLVEGIVKHTRPIEDAAPDQLTDLPGETFEDIFEDAVTTEPGEQKASASQKKKLDVLVGQLRVEGGPLHTEHLYTAVEQLRTNGLSAVADVGGGLLPEADPDGTLHWSKLRETLTREEAHNLIDRLSTLQSHVEPVASRRADP